MNTRNHSHRRVQSVSQAVRHAVESMINPVRPPSRELCPVPVVHNNVWQSAHRPLMRTEHHFSTPPMVARGVGQRGVRR
jgi:hypothetical protein